jgi:hypothetical protein
MESGVVLIVEDRFICTYLRSVLTRAGYRAVEAEHRTAVSLIHSGEVPVKAIITNAPETLQAEASRLPLIYTTSCPNPDATEGYRCYRILRKPFQPADLLDALREVCAAVVT